MSPLDQTPYWDAAAESKTFGHPFDAARFANAVPAGALVLDAGCGYGRVTSELDANGWRAVGVDPSARMLARARRVAPRARLVRATPGTLPLRDGSVGAAVLFAVLTCVPEDDAQRGLVAEIARVLRPGGVAYVSDLLLNSDERNVARYDAAKGRGAPYGVFELPEGVVLRHHDPAWIARLFAAWTTIDLREFTATTMNGHASRAFQLLATAPLPRDAREARASREAGETPTCS